MGHLVYDVAASLDGYIAGPGGDVSAFPADGDHVDAYRERLARYRAVVMGRRTYEFGYAYGLTPGQRAYPHLEHVLFSTGIELPAESDVGVERDPDGWLDAIDALKATSAGAVYLCGGGRFAGYLLAHGRIDALVVKLAPVVLGGGTPLFGGVAEAVRLRLRSMERHDSGVVTQHWHVDATGRDSPRASSHAAMSSQDST